MAATQPGGRFYTLQDGCVSAAAKPPRPVGEGFQPSRQHRLWNAQNGRGVHAQRITIPMIAGGNHAIVYTAPPLRWVRNMTGN